MRFTHGRLDGGDAGIRRALLAMEQPKNLRILVVEDHAGLRAQIVAVLVGAGWKVEDASDGRLALQTVLNEPPDMLSIWVCRDWTAWPCARSFASAPTATCPYSC